MGLSACRIPQYRTRNINVEPSADYCASQRKERPGLYPLTTRVCTRHPVHCDPAVLEITSYVTPAALFNLAFRRFLRFDSIKLEGRGTRVEVDKDAHWSAETDTCASANRVSI